MAGDSCGNNKVVQEDTGNHLGISFVKFARIHGPCHIRGNQQNEFFAKRLKVFFHLWVGAKLTQQDLWYLWISLRGLQVVETYLNKRGANTGIMRHIHNGVQFGKHISFFKQVL